MRLGAGFVLFYGEGMGQRKAIFLGSFIMLIGWSMCLYCTITFFTYVRSTGTVVQTASYGVSQLIVGNSPVLLMYHHSCFIRLAALSLEVCSTRHDFIIDTYHQKKSGQCDEHRDDTRLEHQGLLTKIRDIIRLKLRF
jgi:hypothetical protein